jgi:predicted transcriptional regulator
MAWPTTDKPRTEFVTIRLSTDEAADLDLYADSHGLSRSAAVRAAVSRVIAAEAKRAARQKRSAAPGPKMRGVESGEGDE